MKEHRRIERYGRAGRVRENYDEPEPSVGEWSELTRSRVDLGADGAIEELGRDDDRSARRFS
jgi:hypothetical protein